MRKTNPIYIFIAFIALVTVAEARYTHIDYYGLKLNHLIDIKAQLTDKDAKNLKEEKAEVISEYSSKLTEKMRPYFKNQADLAKAVQAKMDTHSVRRDIERILVKEVSKQLRFDPKAKARRCNLLNMRKALKTMKLGNEHLEPLREAARNRMGVVAVASFKSEDKLNIELHIDNGDERESLELDPIEFSYANFSDSDGTKDCISLNTMKHYLSRQLKSKELKTAIVSAIDSKKSKDENFDDSLEISRMIEVEN